MISPFLKSDSISQIDYLTENPILTKEEITCFQTFFRLFQNEKGLSQVSRMIDSLENLVDLNTGVIRKVLLWIKKSNNGQGDLSRHQFRTIREAFDYSSDAFGFKRTKRALLQANFTSYFSRMAWQFHKRTELVFFTSYRLIFPRMIVRIS